MAIKKARIALKCLFVNLAADKLTVAFSIRFLKGAVLRFFGRGAGVPQTAFALTGLLHCTGE